MLMSKMSKMGWQTIFLKKSDCQYLDSYRHIHKVSFTTTHFCHWGEKVAEDNL